VCSAQCLRCQLSKVSGLTENTCAQRCLGIREDNAANHSRSVGSPGPRVAALRSRAGAPAARRPWPPADAAATSGPTVASVSPDTPVRQSPGHRPNAPARPARPPTSCSDAFLNGTGVRHWNITGIQLLNCGNVTASSRLNLLSTAGGRRRQEAFRDRASAWPRHKVVATPTDTGRPANGWTPIARPRE
jgi:hypothetical protein